MSGLVTVHGAGDLARANRRLDVSRPLRERIEEQIIGAAATSRLGRAARRLTEGDVVNLAEEAVALFQDGRQVQRVLDKGQEQARKNLIVHGHSKPDPNHSVTVVKPHKTSVALARKVLLRDPVRLAANTNPDATGPHDMGTYSYPKQYFATIMKNDTGNFPVDPMLQYHIEPTNWLLFPTIATVAKRYRYYKFEELEVIYEPTCNAFSQGEIMMCAHYGDTHAAPSTISEYSNYARAPDTATKAGVIGSVRSPLRLKLSPAFLKGGLTMKRVSDKLEADPAEFIGGHLFISTLGQAAAGEAGVLSLTYKVSFFEYLPTPSPMRKLHATSIFRLGESPTAGFVVPANTGNWTLPWHILFGDNNSFNDLEAFTEDGSISGETANHSIFFRPGAVRVMLTWLVHESGGASSNSLDFDWKVRPTATNGAATVIPMDDTYVAKIQGPPDSGTSPASYTTGTSHFFVFNTNESSTVVYNNRPIMDRGFAVTFSNNNLGAAYQVYASLTMSLTG